MQNAVPEGDAPRAGLGFVLDHFGKHGAQNAFVDFRDATPVNLRVLDLVVLSKSGKCEIGPESELDPNMLLPARAWSSRAKVLARHFGKVTVEVEKARTKFEEEGAGMLAHALLPRISAAKKLARHGTYYKGRFVYPLRRTTRVREPLALSLLLAFSRYLSRDAHEHDFSKTGH